MSGRSKAEWWAALGPLPEYEIAYPEERLDDVLVARALELVGHVRQGDAEAVAAWLEETWDRGDAAGLFVALAGAVNDHLTPRQLYAWTEGPTIAEVDPDVAWSGSLCDYACRLVAEDYLVDDVSSESRAAYIEWERRRRDDERSRPCGEGCDHE